MDPFSTHLPVLAACVAKTEGPILELGSGNYSTLMLHHVCKVTQRQLVTVDWDETWFESVKSCLSPQDWHTVILAKMDGIEHIPVIMGTDWSVVFVDHWPSWNRRLDLPKMADIADLIVAHDSSQEDLGLTPVFDTFKYQFTWKVKHPWTTVVSNRIPIDFL